MIIDPTNSKGVAIDEISRSAFEQ